jgi:hypothetical protein
MKNISAPEIAKLGIGFALGYLTYKLVSVVGADKQTDRL